MKIKNLLILATCAAVLLSSMSLGGCSSEEAWDGSPIPSEVLTVPDAVEADKPSDGVVQACKDLLDGAFAASEPVSPDELTYTQAVSDTGDFITLTGYVGNRTTVVLPDEIDGVPVTAISEDFSSLPEDADVGAVNPMHSVVALSIPDSVTSIGFGALSECKKLVTLRTPTVTCKDAAYLGALFGASSYEINAARVPSTLEILIVGGGVESIPDYALYDCRFTCVSLPETVTEIGDFAFYGCKRLVYVNVEETAIETIGERAFANCALLLRLDLPETVTEIGFATLEGCASIERLTLPFVGGSQTENTYLGYLLGAKAYTLTSGYVPASLAEIVLTDGCTAIPDNAFLECTSLRRVTIPRGVTSVGRRAFYGCEKLTAVELPDGVKTIGDDAFHGCIRMTDVTVGEGLESLGIQAFMRCLSLERVTLPESVTAIPNACFANCISLETVKASGVKRADGVGSEAYRNCEKLVEAPFRDAAAVENE